MKAADAVGLSKSYKQKVQSGKIDIQTIKNEDLADKIKKYQDYYEKALACKDAVDELKRAQAELYSDKFNLVLDQYEGRLSVYDHFSTMLEESISKSEAKGFVTSTKYYSALQNNEYEKQKILKSEHDKLLAELSNGMKHGAFKYGSQEWRDMTNQINEVTQALNESKTAVVEYNNEMRSIKYQIFDMLQEKISGITEESEFLIDLMENSKLFDDKGQLTDRGQSTMGLHGVNYNTYMAQADRYAEEIRKIDKFLAEDPYDQVIVERRKELIESQRDMILAAEEEKQAIKDMVEEGMDLELDALNKLIESYEEALDSQKDLYDYQRNISDQTKDIAKIEKQLAAYRNDTSEEAKAKIQGLKVSLEESKQDLQDAEYDKYISDQKTMLGDMYNEYEEVLNKRLDNVDALIADMISQTNANAETIKDTLNEAAESVGYTMSDEMTKIWDTANNELGVITTYSEDFNSWTGTLNQTIQGIDLSIKNMMSEINQTANKYIEQDINSAASRLPQANTPEKKPTTTKKNTTTSKNNSTGGDGKAKVGDKATFKSGSYYGNSSGGGGSGNSYKGKQVYITLINAGSKYPYHISTGKKFGSGDLGWVKLSQLSGYALGKKLINSNEFAWTQEGKKEEYIIRPSDGAILTPIARKGSVLNHEASGNIWNVANDPSKFIKDNIGLNTLKNVSENSTKNYTQNLGGVVFNLPNVKNYDELLSAMQRDKNFERLINAMTVDRIAGKSSLMKNKSIRN